MTIISIDTTPATVVENQPFDITTDFQNIGTGRADEVEVAVSLRYEGIAEQQEFLGRMMPNQEVPVVFAIDGLPEGVYHYNTSISYIDKTGAHKKVRQNALHVVSRYSVLLDMIFNSLALCVVGGVAIVGYYIWTRHRKKDT